MRALIASALAVVLLVTARPLLVAQSAGDHWVGTWSTAEVARPQVPPPPAPAVAPLMPNQCPVVAPAAPPVAPAPGQTFAPQPFMQFTNQTLRQIVHTSIGGAKVRIVLSNAYGNTPLTIGAAHIALRDRDAAIQPASDRPLTFSGRPTVTIPAKAIAYSDSVDLAVPPLADIAVDVYLPGTTDTSSPFTMHPVAFQTNYVSETGNYAGKTALPTVGRVQSWFVLSRVDVLVPASIGGLVTFGDSITDGTRSTPDTNNRWPDQLMRRAAAQPGGPNVSIMNAGIAGNRVLSDGAYNAGTNALSRFDLDVLSSPGVTHVIVLEGINDIQNPNARQNPTPTAEDIIAGHKQLIERAHARGVKIYGATLTPYYGAGNYTEIGEAKRQAVNQWIRTGGAYDAVIDFDRATRDPNDPKKFLAAYDSCDHLHPNDAGYKAMADAVDLALFRPGPAATRTVSR
jgi:lysophospholipase L1-like esterase